MSGVYFYFLRRGASVGPSVTKELSSCHLTSADCWQAGTASSALSSSEAGCQLQHWHRRFLHLGRPRWPQEHSSHSSSLIGHCTTTIAAGPVATTAWPLHLHNYHWRPPQHLPASKSSPQPPAPLRETCQHRAPLLACAATYHPTVVEAHSLASAHSHYHCHCYYCYQEKGDLCGRFCSASL